MNAAPARTYRLTVEDARDEAPGVRTLRFRLPAGADLRFQPGQFMMFELGPERKVKRAYSLSSSPLSTDTIEVTLGSVGEFSKEMAALGRGDVVSAAGPYGRFVYDEGIAHAVLISGGTGVTPFRSILRFIAEKGLPNRATLMQSCRTPEHILFREELRRLGERKNIRVYTTVTRPQEMRAGDRWDGPVGRIDLERIRRTVPDLDSAHFFLCGPNQLVQALTGALQSAGVPRERIHREQWGEF